MKYKKEKCLELFMQFLRKQGIPIKPISSEDLINLKRLVQSYKLPKTYLDFMEEAGGGGVEFWKGSSYKTDELPILKNAADELLRENNISIKLLENQFVFFMHQGYQFYFFDLTEGDNPPVYYYGEGENMEMYIKKYDTFVEFLIEYYNEVESLI